MLFSTLSILSPLFFLAAGAAGVMDNEEVRALAGHSALGSFWAIYNISTSPADDSCIVAEGESVPESCCLGTDDLVPHAALQGESMDSCFVLGPDLVPFSGCVSDGVYGYGENCVGEGAPFMASDAEECGCDFVIEGSGCYKANDIPGQQWFVYLDASKCVTPTPPPELGSFWAIYNISTSPADDSCIVAEGESVPESCCLGTDDLVPHAALQGESMDSCFVLGPDLVPFSGCVSDGVYGYGENCVGEGAPFMASDAEECGCDFVIEGSGCYKANDIPGQQWFVYLDASKCVTPTPPPELGSFWAIYNISTSPADNSCIVAEGESVPDSCCLGTDDLVPHAALQGESMDSCFVLGPDLVPFSGCVSDGVYGYGENCVGEGAPFMASDAEECGCDFVIEGSGCYKANDIPGQQWFVYLDSSSCAATEAPTPDSAVSVTLAAVTTVVAIGSMVASAISF